MTMQKSIVFLYTDNENVEIKVKKYHLKLLQRNEILRFKYNKACTKFI